MKWQQTTLCFAAVLTLGISSAQAQVPVTSGLQLYLRADAGVTTNASGLVSNWADQTANAYDVSQSTASLKPLYVANQFNGMPALRFDGVDDLLNNTATSILSSGSARTVFVVGRSSPGINLANGALFTFRRSGPVMTLQQLDYGGPWYIYSDGICCSETSYGLPGFNAFVADYASAGTGNLLQYRFNGSSLPVFGAPVAAETGTTGFTVGNREDYPTIQVWRGDIAEVLVYDSVLSSTDHQSVDEYLFAKYSIPEPCTAALLGLGVLLLWRRRP